MKIFEVLLSVSMALLQLRSKIPPSPSTTPFLLFQLHFEDREIKKFWLLIAFQEFVRNFLRIHVSSRIFWLILGHSPHILGFWLSFEKFSKNPGSRLVNRSLRAIYSGKSEKSWLLIDFRELVRECWLLICRQDLAHFLCIHVSSRNFRSFWVISRGA